MNKREHDSAGSAASEIWTYCWPGRSLLWKCSAVHYERGKPLFLNVSFIKLKVVFESGKMTICSYNKMPQNLWLKRIHIYQQCCKSEDWVGLAWSSLLRATKHKLVWFMIFGDCVGSLSSRLKALGQNLHSGSFELLAELRSIGERSQFIWWMSTYLPP